MTHLTYMTQSGRSDAPTIEVLYFEGCPNHERAVALVRQVLAAEQIAAPVHLIRIATNAEARRHGFYGSPTIRINGEDIAPVSARAVPGLVCRVYPTPDGHMAPVPAYEALVAALRRE